jgi:type II secretory pathway component PulF
LKFKYIAFDKTGKKQKGLIEATSVNEAKSLLKDLVILEIKPIKSFSFDVNFSKVNKEDLSRLFFILGLYLKSSIPLVSAIRLTKNQIDNSKLVKFLDYLEKEIKEGKSFYVAIESQNIISIPAYIVNSVKIGEESGKLSLVLIEISKFLKDEERFFSKTKQALVYPLFIIIVSIFMISFMLTEVVPKIVKVFENLHQKLPSITIFVINSGNFLKEHYLAIFFIFIFFISLFLIFYRKYYKFRLFIDSMILKIPVVNKIVISKELGRFSYLVYVLTSSGVNYINAINLASNTIENEKIKSIFQNALQEVFEGKKLSISLSKAGFNFDKSFLQALALAEETGEVSEILKNISEIYIEENENRINTILSLIEPMLILIVGGVVGFIVTALLLPIFSMNLFK